MSDATSAGMSRRQLLETAGTAAAAAAIAALGLAAPGEAAQPAPQPIAQAWVDAWNAHDANAVTALFTSDALYEDVATGAMNHGTTAITAFAQGFFTAIPDLKVELVNAVSEGDLKAGHVTIEWIFGGTDMGVYKTGKQFSVRGTTVIDLAEGKIARNSDYWDVATLLRQVGLLPKGL